MTSWSRISGRANCQQHLISQLGLTDTGGRHKHSNIVNEVYSDSFSKELWIKTCKLNKIIIKTLCWTNNAMATLPPNDPKTILGISALVFFLLFKFHKVSATGPS